MKLIAFVRKYSSLAPMAVSVSQSLAYIFILDFSEQFLLRELLANI